MRKVGILLLLATVSSAYALPRPQRQQQQEKRAGNRASVLPRPRANLQNTIFVFYFNQIQKQVEFTDEVRGKIMPFVQEFIRSRFEISDRRRSAINQLRRAIANGGSEADLKRLTRELDAADEDFQNNQQKFLNSVDPFLNPIQQAKLRLIQIQADDRLRRMLEEVQQQNSSGQPQNAAPATSSPD
jgi:hypothetical protein